MELDKITLKQYGFTQAGLCSGKSQQYKTILQEIDAGSITLIEKTLPTGELNKLNNEIRELDKKKADLEDKNKKIKDDISPFLEVKDELQDDINKLSLGKYIIPPDKTRNNFSFYSFGIATFGLFLFLCIFYPIMIFRALSSVCVDICGTQILCMDCLSYAGNNIWWLIITPFIPLVLALLLHRFIENRQLILSIGIGLFVLAVDMFLAFQIWFQIETERYNNMERENAPDGIFDGGFSEAFSANETIILMIFGFFLYLIFGLMLHFWVVELEKGSYRSITKKKRGELKKVQAKINGKNSTVTDNQAKIDGYTNAVNTLQNQIDGGQPTDNTKKQTILSFHRGWYDYLDYLKDDEEKQRIDTIKDKYIEKYEN